MLIYNLLFYVFSSLLVGASLAVVLSRNPVHSVFFLIFAFFNVAALFVLLGAEFLAMSLVIVYVGAVAILFLFLVMMLDIDLASINKITTYSKLLFLVLAGLFFIELSLILYYSLFRENVVVSGSAAPFVMDGVQTDTEQLGLLLYTDYGYLFQICGLILFAAVVSAIVLTHREKIRFKKVQNSALQLARTKHDSVKLVKVKTGGGVDV